MARADGLKIGVVGATGVVGEILLRALERRRFPVGELRPFSSGRDPKARVRFRGKPIPAPGISEAALAACDLLFFVSSDEVSKARAERLARAGVWVIDDSSAFRMQANVPLVIPEVNAHALSAGARLIAGPNCTVTGAAVAGHPLHRAVGVRRVRMASYQAVSGAGREALRELYAQARSSAKNLEGGDLFPRLAARRSSALPRPIAFNIFPQVGSFRPGGECGEEIKVRDELRKIWGAPELAISATTVRVPVVRGHSLALWLETARPLSPARARALLKNKPGVRLWPEGEYPTPAEADGSDPVHVGRVRASGAHPNELSLWVVSDNLLKGAALNSVQIAELLLKKGWLRAR
ncbi:MAG TPA: aspartate-semialdehyde dehydrogenase [Elusimicrobiota bacterium]|jgi:aspartate-semialdehyde dehydrogenase|nr:aspartate-semialdehyde dehydrogenase [Elusimicrobiota bacterium]